jgi:hypothetical protein
MYLVDFPNLAPSVCFICESAPPGATFVDTARNYDPSGTTHLGPGRKYLCSSCIRDTADVAGILDEARATLIEDCQFLTEELDEAREQLKAYENLQGALDAFVKRDLPLAPAITDEDVPPVNRKPRAKKVTADGESS